MLRSIMAFSRFDCRREGGGKGGTRSKFRGQRIRGRGEGGRGSVNGRGLVYSLRTIVPVKLGNFP